MFEWNVEELRSILWGEPGESNNLTDLYPGQSGAKPEEFSGDVRKKGRDEQSSDINTIEQRKSITTKEHRFSTYDSSCASWPAPDETSSSKFSRSQQPSLRTDASKNLKKGPKIISLGEEISEFDNMHEVCEKPAGDGEESDFIFCGLANIGSLEDIDGVFSNTDSVLGDMEAVNAEELWPPLKNVASSPIEFPPLPGDSSDVPLGVLQSSKHQSMIKYNKVLDSCPASSAGCEDPQALVTHGKIQGSHKQMNDSTAAKLNRSLDKGKRQRKFIKDQESEKKSNNSLYDPCVPSSLLGNSSQDVQSSRFSGLNLPAPLYGNIMAHNPTPSILLSSDYEAVPTNANSSKNPSSMTPKEKIEKLRRRQQMRAILAIQKQQQQLGNQVSAFENEKPSFGWGICSSFPSFDSSSSNISMVFDNCSLEETVLYQLQDAIHKLDMGVRLTVRDSLFRLAISAAQRQYPNDTSSACASYGDEAHRNKDVISNKRFNKLPAETETNPIDRTVAHLLFNRHPEVAGIHAETSESPSLKGIADGYFQGTSHNTQIQMVSSHSMKYPSSVSYSNQSISSAVNPVKGA